MKLKVADLIVEVTPKYELLKTRSVPYIYNGEKEPDIVIPLSEQFFIDRQKENPHLSLDECEYIFTGSCFYTEIVKFDGVMLHASAVQYENFAYLFSADSGTGKSTHTHLWLKKFPGAEILNDDKPAIRCIDGKYYAFGTPWSGKYDESVNTMTEIAGITFLSRGEANEITRVTGEDVMIDFLNQTVRPGKKDYMISFMETLDKILSDVPVFRLKCNISPEAVETSYNAMKRS
ncbi:MAG: hypothetical protein E7557_06125 [Ruminococcaceae bacterium]|nr:hypothetical protein [Oscillospiraceae bacterium]